MKKIMVCIANYGNGNLKYLNKLLKEYNSMNKYEIDVYIDTTDDVSILKYKNIGIFKTYHNKSIAKSLVYEHKKRMEKYSHKYDYFIYSENDILIKEYNIDWYIEVTKNIPDNYITGFLRYEISDFKIYLLDMYKNEPIKKFLEINYREYFQMYNVHQGCYIISKQQLKKAINSGNFITEPHNTQYHKKGYAVLESGASDIFTSCGFKHKILPIQMTNFLVHHLPNKYVNIQKSNMKTLPEFKNQLQKKFKNKYNLMLWILKYYYNTLKIILKKHI